MVDCSNCDNWSEAHGCLLPDDAPEDECPGEPIEDTPSIDPWLIPRHDY